MIKVKQRFLRLFLVILILNTGILSQSKTNDKNSDNSLPDIQVIMEVDRNSFVSDYLFKFKSTDFLSSVHKEIVNDLDTFSLANINKTNSENITPLLSILLLETDTLSKKKNTEIQRKSKKLLELGADPNIQSNLGFSPLMRACEFGFVDIAKILIKNQAEPNLKNYHNQTALHFAVESGSMQLVELLLDNKSNPKVIDITGRKPIFYTNNSEVIKLLKDISELNLEEKFILSVIENDQIELEKCIEKGVNINSSFCDQKNALMYACENGNLQTVQKLISSGIDFDAVDYRGDNALFYAIKSGNLEITDLLINNGIDINLENKHGETPLIIAVKENQNIIVKSLMKNEAGVSVKDTYGLTAIDWALKYQYQDIIITITKLSDDYEFNNQLLFRSIDENLYDLIDIFIKNGHDLNSINNKGQTPLYRSILLKKYDLALKFINQKVDLNIPSDSKLTPLMLAIEYSNNDPLIYNHTETFAKQFNNFSTYNTINLNKTDPEINLVDTLLNHNAEINPKNLDSTPLISSIMTSNFNLVKKMINSGAEINCFDKNRISALQYLLSAMKNDSKLLEFVKYFHSIGADLEWKNINKTSVLIYAVSSNNLEVFKYIYENIPEPDINFIDSQGVTALFYAVKNNNTELISYLLKLGADINISRKLSYDQNKYKILYQSIWSGDDISVFLIDNGIDINQTFYQKMTPLMLACQRKRLMTIRSLLEAGVDQYAEDTRGKTAFDYGNYTTEITKILNQYKK